MEKISLIIPVYNEAEVIERVVRDFHNEVISKIPESEFIVAEDGSTDGTKEILKKLEKEISFTFISGDGRKGYSGAVKDALKLGKNELIFFSDSDGQQDPKDYWKIREYIDEYDVIIGYKHPRVDPFFRVFISKIFQQVIKFIFGIKFRDINCGFRLIKKKVVDDIIDDMGTTDFFSTEFIIRANNKGYKIKEIPVNHFKREGESRGLPTKELPKSIFKLVCNLLSLKKELKVKHKSE